MIPLTFSPPHARRINSSNACFKVFVSSKVTTCSHPDFAMLSSPQSYLLHFLREHALVDESPTLLLQQNHCHANLQSLMFRESSHPAACPRHRVDLDIEYQRDHCASRSNTSAPSLSVFSTVAQRFVPSELRCSIQPPFSKHGHTARHLLATRRYARPARRNTETYPPTLAPHPKP